MICWDNQMHRKKHISAIVIVSVFCLPISLWANNVDSYPPAPLFSLIDISGQKLELAAYRGRVVVLNFWASWCGPCREEIPQFVELQARYESERLVVMGLTVEDRLDSVRSIKKELDINYRLALVDNDLGARYGAVGVPTTFVLGRDGRIYSKHSGKVIFEELIKEVTQLLASPETGEAAKFVPVGKFEPIELPSAAELNPDVPGVDIGKLSLSELATFKNRLENERCGCDCGRNILLCVRDHFGCSLSRNRAKAELKEFLKAKQK